MRYVVFVDDNARYMDEEAQYQLGDFDDGQAALTACRRVVDGFLVRNCQQGMSADELYEQYTTFGEDPHIVTDDQDCKFSARSYAQQRCAEICKDATVSEPKVAVPELSARFREALTFAAQLHEAQTRKGPRKIPYIGHLLGVASIVIDHGGNEDEAIAALLHDAIEDQGGGRAETVRALKSRIRNLFGESVLAIVEGCTDTEEDPKPPWKQRKQSYLEHLGLEKNRSVLVVSAADKLHNAQAILRDYRLEGDSVWERFRAGKDEQLWYLSELVRAFRKADLSSPIVDELERVVSTLANEVNTRNG